MGSDGITTAGSGVTGSSAGGMPFFPMGGMGGFGGQQSNGGGRPRSSWESEEHEIWDPDHGEVSPLGADGMIGQNPAFSDSGTQPVDFGKEKGRAARDGFPDAAGLAGGLAARQARARAQEILRSMSGERADGKGDETGWPWREWTDKERDAWAPER